jgi:thioredoxin
MAGAALQLNSENWQAEVEQSKVPVLVDFWAAWCGPCRAIAPSVEELAGRVAGRATVGKVDVDANPELAMRYGVSSIPTLLVVRGGEVVDRTVGSMTLQAMQAFLEKHIAAVAAVG